MKQLLLILFFLFSYFSFSQDGDSTLVRLEETLKHATIDSTKIRTMLELGEYHIDKDFNKARQILNEVFGMLKKSKNQKFLEEKASVYSLLGIIARREANLTKGLTYYHESLSIYKELGDSINASNVLHNIGMVHRYLKNHKKSISYYKKSIQLKESVLGQTYEIACGYNMMGVSYKRLKKIDSATYCYNKAIQLFSSIDKIEDVYGVKNNIASLLTGQKKYNEALLVYLESYDFYKKTGSKSSLAAGSYNLSRIYKQLKEYDTAMEYANISLAIAKEAGFKEMIAKAYLRKSSLNAKMKNFEEAYENYRMFNRHSDSIHNIENIKKIQALELNYEYTQEKINDSLRFAQEKKVTELKATNEASKKNLYFILFCVTLLSAIIITYLIKRNFKQKQLILEQKNRTLLDEKQKISKAFDQLKLVVSSEDEINIKQELAQLRILTKEDWKLFKSKFEQQYPNFMTTIYKVPFSFTKSEERFLILKKMNLDNEEISEISGISKESVTKTQYRLRKKLGADKGISLINYIEKLTDL